MHTDQQPYRELYDAILEHEGDDPHGAAIAPWLRTADEERRWLESFGRRRGSPIPAVTIEESWRLFALSRVAQVLVRLHPAEVEPFMSGLGLEPVRARAFDPFLHEIVTVDESEADAEVTQEYWPAFMLGPLLVMRAGCRVAARPDVLRKEIAESATLYWATARASGRPTNDLSDGWGGNSSWRTRFRRDYLLDGVRHYNVDADASRMGDDDLTEADRIELVRFRSFVTCTKRHGDRFPYNDSYRE